MTFPVDTVRRFYNTLWCGDVPGGRDLLGEDACQQHQRCARRRVGISDLVKRGRRESLHF